MDARGNPEEVDHRDPAIARIAQQANLERVGVVAHERVVDALLLALHGVVRGRPPRFFDGDAQTMAGPRFHLETEAFACCQPAAMQHDPLWIDVTQLMQKGRTGLGEFVTRPGACAEFAPRIGELVA